MVKLTGEEHEHKSHIYLLEVRIICDNSLHLCQKMARPLCVAQQKGACVSACVEQRHTSLLVVLNYFAEYSLGWAPF